MNVALRPATLADETRLLAYMRALRAEDPMPTQEIVGFAASGQAMRLLLDDDSLGRAWLILADGQPVGYVALTFSFSLELGGKTAVVDELFVDRAQRRRGIAREALRLVEAEARRMNALAMLLEVGAANSAAAALYRHCGFECRKYQLMAKVL